MPGPVREGMRSAATYKFCPPVRERAVGWLSDDEETVMEPVGVFTKENGEMLHPANGTRRFIEPYEEIDLPPVRLHDLRHGAATLAHAAGADLKDIQEMLGHS